MNIFSIEFEDLPEIVQDLIQAGEYQIAVDYLMTMIGYVENLDSEKELN